MSQITFLSNSGGGGPTTISITGDTGPTLTSGSFTITGDATGLTFAGAGSTLTLGGVLGVPYGGTGDSSLTLNGVLYGNGVAPVGVTAAGTTGQVLTATTGGPPMFATPVSGGIITIDGDVGSVTGPTVSLTGLTTAGSSVSFSGSGTAMTFNSTDALNNVIIGLDAGNPTISGSYNVGLGWQTLTSVTSGAELVALGVQALNSNSTGDYNIAIGSNALQFLVDGNYNIAIGQTAGFNYSGAESSNIIIASGGSTGITGESNTCRIGTASGTGIGQLEATFIAGIAGFAVTGTLNFVTIDTGTNQLGSQPFLASSITITGDSGGALTGSAFTFTGGSTGLTFAGAGTTETMGGTLVVAHGGTGDTSFVAYAPVVGGTTTTGPLQSASTGLSTAGFVFTSAGASSLPTFIAPGSLSYTSVTTSPYVVLATDSFLGVTTATIPITIELPNAPATGRVFTIKDVSGNAGTNNITVRTVSGAVNVDLATTFVMNTSLESINVLFNGSSYLVY